MKILNTKLAKQITLVTECYLYFHRHDTNTYTSNMVDTMSFMKKFKIKEKIYEMEVVIPIQLLKSENTSVECRIWHPDRRCLTFPFSDLKKLKNYITPKQFDFVENKIKEFK